jgi:hypothetical protein
MTSPAATGMVVETRLFIGNLHRDVTVSDIEARLRSFGTVRDVEISHRLTTTTDDDDHASFCHATLLATPTQAKSCIRTLHRTKWRGGSLRVEPADSLRFDLRLQREREAALQKEAEESSESSESSTTARMAHPVENERGWQKIKGRLMPRLTIAGPFKGAPSVREVPENLITRLKYLSDGPLAPKSKELSLADLHKALATTDPAEEARQERRAAARREHELRLVAINAKRQLASDRAQLRKRKATDEELQEAEDDTSGSASESFHGEAIPVELSDVGDDSFEAVDEEASVDDFAAARARFQLPNFDDDDDDDADLAAVLKKARKSPPPAAMRDEEGPVSPPTSPVNDNDDHDVADVELPADPTPAQSSRVQVNVPRLRSLFFNVESSDPTYNIADQGVLKHRAVANIDDAVDDAVPANVADDAVAAVDDDDDDEYEARPINAALDAGKFSLMPATATDSFLASLFDGGARAVAKTEVAPKSKSAQPQRVFRLFAPSAKGDETAISPAMQARQSSQPVAGLKSATLIAQLERQSKKAQQKAQKQAEEQAASITKPKPLFDLTALLATKPKAPKAPKAKKERSAKQSQKKQERGQQPAKRGRKLK